MMRNPKAALRGVVRSKIDQAVLLTLLTLLALRPTGARAEPAPLSVAVDTRALDDRTHRRLEGNALERGLVMRLVREGFTVTAPRVRHDLRLSLEARGETLVLRVHTGRSVETRTVALDAAPVVELHLEILHKAISLVRAAEAQLRQAPARPAAPAAMAPAPKDATGARTAPRIALSASKSMIETSAPSLERTRCEDVPTPWWARSTPRWSLSSGTGWIARLGGTDPMFVLGLRRGLWRGLGAHADLGLGLSPHSGTFSLWAWQAQLGLSYRVLLGRAFFVEAGVRVGVAVSHASDQGVANAPLTTVDFLMSFPARLGWAFSQHLGVELYALGGFSQDGRDFVKLARTGETLTWYRGGGRFEAGLAFAFTWGD